MIGVQGCWGWMDRSRRQASVIGWCTGLKWPATRRVCQALEPCLIDDPRQVALALSGWTSLLQRLSTQSSVEGIRALGFIMYLLLHQGLPESLKTVCRWMLFRMKFSFPAPWVHPWPGVATVWEGSTIQCLQPSNDRKRAPH